MRLLALILAVTGVGLDLPPEINIAAVATAPAVRVNPPPPAEAAPPSGMGSAASAGGRCVGWEPLLAGHRWNVERMSRIMHRESRCQPDARNASSSATGLLQILASHCPWLARQMDTWCTRDRLTDPQFNIAAAATLWAEQGYTAWSTS